MIEKLFAAGLATLLVAGLFNCKATAPTAQTQVLAKAAAPDASMADTRQYYALKVYSFDTEAQQTATDAYLRGAYLPALGSVADGRPLVFHRRLDPENPTRQTYVLIPLRSLSQLEAVDALTTSGGDAGAGAYLNAPHDAPPYRRIETIVMRAFAEMPRMAAPEAPGDARDGWVFELRSYESATEDRYRAKLRMFNEGGEIPLFERLGFHAVFFGEVLAGPSMPNLMYMTSFPSMAVRDSLWKEFVASPEWVGLKDDPQYANSVSKNTIVFLDWAGLDGEKPADLPFPRE